MLLPPYVIQTPGLDSNKDSSLLCTTLWTLAQLTNECAPTTLIHPPLRSGIRGQTELLVHHFYVFDLSLTLTFNHVDMFPRYSHAPSLFRIFKEAT